LPFSGQYFTDILPLVSGGTLFVVLQGSAEVMEDDTPTSHTVELKEVFCKLLAFAIRGRFYSNAKMIQRYAHTIVRSCKTNIGSEFVADSQKFIDSFDSREVFFQLVRSRSLMCYCSHPSVGKNNNMPDQGWVKALELCVAAFFPEDAVREAENTFPDVVLPRP